MKKLDIIYQTWIRSIERLAYLIVSLESVQRHLVIADDVEVHTYVCAEEINSCFHEELTAFCISKNINLVWKKTKPSLSSSLNYANSLGDAPYILFMQDDWFLLNNLHIYECMQFLEDHERDYMIRLNYRDEFIYSTIAEDNHRFAYLDPGNVGYYYSDNPHIKKREYHEHTGPFSDSIVDGVDQGRCENSMNRKAKKIAHKCRILCVRKPHFIHIGEMNTTLTEKTFRHR